MSLLVPGTSTQDPAPASAALAPALLAALFGHGALRGLRGDELDLGVLDVVA
jgi:hypothetical protein